MQANVSHQSAIDYIFGVIDTIDGQTYESLTNRNITKTASVKSIEIVSNLCLMQCYTIFYVIQ